MVPSHVRKLPTLKRIKTRIFTTAVFVGFHALRARYGVTPVPLVKAIALWKRAGGRDAFPLPDRQLKLSGRKLRDPFLARQLELGSWALTADVINFLSQEIMARKPKAILEFGSGISTLCFAHFIRKLYGDSDRIRLFSVEENADFKRQMEQRLASLGLEKGVRICHAPVCRQKIKDTWTDCYRLPEDFLREVEKAAPELILIDGPITLKWGETTRFGTLPQIAQLLREGACFFLDDALREGELQVAQMWTQRCPEIHIKGILLKGKGLLTGEVRPPKEAL